MEARVFVVWKGTARAPVKPAEMESYGKAVLPTDRDIARVTDEAILLEIPLQGLTFQK